MTPPMGQSRSLYPGTWSLLSGPTTREMPRKLRPSDAESVEGSGLSIPLPAIASTPRRFHLTKSASTTLLNHAHTYTARSGGVTKRKKAARPKIATFVEKSDPTDAPTKSQDHTGTLNPRRPAFDSVDGAAESEADTTGFPKPLPRKRPGATPQELAWRAQQWAKGKGKVSSSAGAPQKETGTAPTAEKSKEQSTSTDGPSTSSTSSSVKQWDYNSPELAALLEQITLEELRKGGGDRATPDSAPSAAPEIKPDSKGAVPVQYPDLKAYAAGLEGEVDEHAKQASMNPDHEMKDAEQHDGDGDDDGDYVYDTYVRHVSMVPSTLQDYDHEHHHKLKSDVNLHPPNIGILIVPPETIAEWEAYGDTIDDGLNDSDYEVDDEDENGKSNSEDYHGNDYPDEEDDDDDDESDEEDGNEDEDEDENEEGDEDGGDDHEDEETG
ncbi:MAG: hypothetical protein M1838_004222 [Thelocarpon superellum]|nr:MAG: hypothetical protein M1838_004222 [Thelocarpon superellum]